MNKGKKRAVIQSDSDDSGASDLDEVGIPFREL